MIKKYYLLSPGPTPIPDEVLAVAAQPIIHHRTPEFSEIFMQVTEGLKYVFQTKEDVFILTSSGTGAMETAIVAVISINGGKFGERWGAICRAYGVSVREIVLEWGADFNRDQLAAELKANPAVKAVFATLSETSSGAIYDIKGFGEVVSQTEAILVVDGISGLGATPCLMDEWKIDILVSGSQKSFMIPPGLAYIAFSPKAWRFVETAKLRCQEGQEELGEENQPVDSRSVAHHPTEKSPGHYQIPGTRRPSGTSSNPWGSHS
jgi:aspartate aminotransferase-like enzyme